MLYHTYELYLNDGEGDPVFEAFTCPSQSELVGGLRRILDERNLESVDVRQFGRHLFTLCR